MTSILQTSASGSAGRRLSSCLILINSLRGFGFRIYRNISPAGSPTQPILYVWVLHRFSGMRKEKKTGEGRHRLVQQADSAAEITVTIVIVFSERAAVSLSAKWVCICGTRRTSSGRPMTSRGLLSPWWWKPGPQGHVFLTDGLKWQPRTFPDFFSQKFYRPLLSPLNGSAMTVNSNVNRLFSTPAETKQNSYAACKTDYDQPLLGERVTNRTPLVILSGENTCLVLQQMQRASISGPRASVIIVFQHSHR